MPATIMHVLLRLIVLYAVWFCKTQVEEVMTTYPAKVFFKDYSPIDLLE